MTQIQSWVPSPIGFFEGFFSLGALPFNHWIMPLPLKSPLIAVCSVWLWRRKKQCMKEAGHKKSQNVLCTTFLALYICDCDPKVTPMLRWCFLLWKFWCEKVGWRVTAMVLCLCFDVALCFCRFGLFVSSFPHSASHKLRKRLLTHIFLLFFLYSFPSHSRLLCFTSQEITFYCLFRSQRTER